MTAYTGYTGTETTAYNWQIGTRGGLKLLKPTVERVGAPAVFGTADDTKKWVKIDCVRMDVAATVAFVMVQKRFPGYAIITVVDLSAFGLAPGIGQIVRESKTSAEFMKTREDCLKLFPVEQVEV